MVIIMRKFATFLFIIFIFICLYSFYSKKTLTVTSFNESKRYDLYTLSYPNGLSFSLYETIFRDLNNDDYHIISYKIHNNYRDSINAQINKITISKGNYLLALDEYLKEYKNILYKYELYSEIDKINRSDFLIKEITIYSNYDVYQKLSQSN